MVKNPRRIFIVGAPGSGKTTLAKKLSEKLNIPHHDLDDIRYPLGISKRSDREAIPMVHHLTTSKAWIIEGIYISWVKTCLDETDLIIWLDIPYHITIYRVIVRFMNNLLRRHLRHGFKSTLLLLKNLTRYHFPKPGTELNDEDEYVTRLKTASVLAGYKDKVVWIKNNEGLKQFMASLV